MDVTLAGLEAFVEVAERKSIRAAADSLGYTPSAISQRLGALEKALGLQLFERLGNSISVTSDAERLRGSAVIALQAVSDLRRLAGESGLGEGVRRRVVLGGFPSGVQLLVPQVFEGLREGGIDLEVVALNGKLGEAELRLGHIDLLIMQEYNVLKQRREEFVYRQLAQEGLVLLVLNGEQGVGLESLADASWIVSGIDTTCGVGVRDLCHLAGFEPRIVCVVDDFGVQQQLVAAGVGVAIMPFSCVAQRVTLGSGGAADGSIVVTELKATRTVTALRRRTSLGDSTLEYVVNELSTVGGKPGPSWV